MPLPGRIIVISCDNLTYVTWKVGYVPRIRADIARVWGGKSTRPLRTFTLAGAVRRLPSRTEWDLVSHPTRSCVPRSRPLPGPFHRGPGFERGVYEPTIDVRSMRDRTVS